MSAYTESNIVHETPYYWVLSVGRKGYEVYRKTLTHSERVASIGHGAGPNLGLERAIAECERRQTEHII